MEVRAASSFFFKLLQRSRISPAFSARSSPKTWGMTVDDFPDDRLGHVVGR